MSSQAQINANRQNAQKSTGPRTTEGKAASSQNSIKHGLTAKYDCISSESQADYDLHRRSILDELNPQSHIESLLAERIVSLSWRLERIVRIQNQVIDAMIFKSDNPSPLTRLADLMVPAHLKKGQPEPSPDIKMGQIVMTDFANSKVLDRLLMYERRMENSLYKTMLELQRLHLTRNLDTLASMDKQTRSQLPDRRPPCPREACPRLRSGGGNLSPISFMQNEPNFKNIQMHSNQVHKRDYEQLLKFSHPKNEPKRTQFKPNLNLPHSNRTNSYSKNTKNHPPNNRHIPSKNEFAKNSRLY